MNPPNNITPGMSSNPQNIHPYQNYYPHQNQYQSQMPIHSSLQVQPSLQKMGSQIQYQSKPNIPPIQYIQQQSNKVYFQNCSPLPQPSMPTDQIMGSMPSRKHTYKALRKFRDDKDEQYAQTLRSILPYSNILSKLVSLEKKLDSTLKKRQLSLQENLPDHHRRNSVVKILKMCIYNTVDSYGKFYHLEDIHNSEVKDVPSFSLRIEGRLQDESSKQRKFSSFFKKIFVQLDKEEFPNEWAIEWTKDKLMDNVDGFEIKRVFKKETTAHIYLYLDYSPEKFKPSRLLADLLNIKSNAISKTQVILNLWNYIRNNELNDPKNRSSVICDEKLINVFGVQRMDYYDIPKLVQPHLLPPDPIQIAYTIKMESDPLENEMWFEIPVEIENPSYQFPLTDQKQNIEMLDIEIHEKLKKVNIKKKKKEFLASFASDPLKFLDDYIGSQIRDYKIVMNHQNRDTDFESQTDFFLQPLSIDASKCYLNNLSSKHSQNTHVSHTKSNYK